MKEFQGKVAVVTGAASGIGRALAERCVQEGMNVVLADIEEQALMQTNQERVPPSGKALLLIGNGLWASIFGGSFMEFTFLCP